MISRAFHVIYAKQESFLGYNMVRVYVLNAEPSVLFVNNETVIDLANFPGTEYVPKMLLSNPKSMISKSSDFTIHTSKNVGNKYVTKYIDLENLDDVTSFRVRVRRKKEFPTNGPSMHPVGKVVAETDHTYGCFPWMNNSMIDNGFSHTKVNLQERVKSFCMTYFQLTSK